MRFTIALQRRRAQNGAVLKGLHIPVLAVLLATLCLPMAAGPRNPGRAAGNAAAKLVDINTASCDELLRIPGMTRVWAARIVRYRPYRSKLELEDHGIVSEAVYERIKNYVIAHRDEK